MRIRPVIVALSAAAAIVLGGGLSVAAASPSPSVTPAQAPQAPQAPQVTPSPDISSTDSFYIDSRGWPGSDWAYSITHNIWYDNPTNQNQIFPTPGAWQEYKFYGPTGNTLCMTLDWPSNIVNGKACTGAASQEWGSTCIPNSGCSGGNCGNYCGNWLFFSQYMQDSHPTYCPGNARAYLSVTASSSNLIMQCPLLGGNNYAITQTWTLEQYS